MAEAEAEANGRLMAAAPDLLADAKMTASALREILAGPQLDEDYDRVCAAEAIIEIEAAIAKAEGR